MKRCSCPDQSCRWTYIAWETRDLRVHQDASCNFLYQGRNGTLTFLHPNYWENLWQSCRFPWQSSYFWMGWHGNQIWMWCHGFMKVDKSHGVSSQLIQMGTFTRCQAHSFGDIAAQDAEITADRKVKLSDWSSYPSVWLWWRLFRLSKISCGSATLCWDHISKKPGHAGKSPMYHL